VQSAQELESDDGPVLNEKSLTEKDSQVEVKTTSNRRRDRLRSWSDRNTKLSNVALQSAKGISNDEKSSDERDAEPSKVEASRKNVAQQPVESTKNASLPSDDQIITDPLESSYIIKRKYLA